MLRLVVITAGIGSLAIAAAGAAVALIWRVSWSDGVGAVCGVGFAACLAIAAMAFLRWLVVGPGALALRALAAVAVAGLVFAGAWFQVRFEAYDGCNWSYGDQPVLAVPVSLVVKKPIADRGGLMTIRKCGRYTPRRFKAGPFGSTEPRP